MADLRSAYFGLTGKYPTDVQEDEAEQYAQRLSASPYQRLGALAGWLSGANIAAGAPGPRYGSLGDPLAQAYMSFGGRGLRKLLGLNKEATPRALGDSLADLAARGQIDRPWPGIYKGAISEGRTQPVSYRAPHTFDLPESSEGLAEFVRRLGGSYKP